MIASPVPPNLRAVLDAFKQEIFYGFNCHEVGKIVSFDADAQTAVVQIEVLKIIVDQQVPYPLLTDCPVYSMSGGTAALTMPVKVGDTCLVLFNDRDLDNWFDSGNIVAPNSSRAHSLSDGLVLVGFRNRANALAGYEVDRASLRNNGAKISVLNDGSVSITGKNGGTVVIGVDGVVTVSSSAGSSLALAGKVALASPSASLRTTLDAIMTALTALNAKTGPSAAVQIALAQTEVANLTQ